MKHTLSFISIIEDLPEDMDFVIVRREKGVTQAAFFNGHTWYDTDGEPISLVTHWCDFPLIKIQ